MDDETIHPAGETSPDAAQVPANTFTKVDNNLTGIGFFSASSKRSRKAIEKTTIVIGREVEYRTSILPSAKYGLPITQDQDYWLALMKLVNEHIQREGKLTNPFTFGTAELQRLLGQCDSGQNYKAVLEWLSVMKFTGIMGGAYNTPKRKWIVDRTGVIDRAVTVGKRLEDGTIADKNYIWFSQWQLDNINAGSLIAIDLGAYTRLENNISRILVPHLQEWLYASQRDGRFEKKYEDVCQLLGVSVYQYRSDIERQFRPSLDELTAFGYLAKWSLDPMADRDHFKFVLWHGQKFHDDRKARIEGKRRIGSPGDRRGRAVRRLPPASGNATAVVIDREVLDELAKRGIGEIDARQILGNMPPGQTSQTVLDLLEYGDHIVSRRRRKFENPPGFYISLLQRNVPVPANFLTSRKAREIEAANQAEHQAHMERQAAAVAAEEEKRLRLNARIAAMPPEIRQALFDQARKELLRETPSQGFKDYLKTNPEALGEDGPVYSRMRQMLSQGWEPEQAPHK